MAYISFQPKDHFKTKLYTGNGSTQSITGVGFQPDMVWVKDRISANSHNVCDVVRGATKVIFPDATAAEVTDATRLTSFDSDGFSIGSNSSWNTNTNTYVSWNWLADNTSGSSNTDGSITSTVSANTDAGFSIVKWTGTGANGTVGHGLGTAPQLIIVKNYTFAGENWRVGIGGNSIAGVSFGGSYQLDNNGAWASGSTIWNSTAPTSSVFSVGTASSTNYSTSGLIAYCFAQTNGFSKFGTYIGNGSADGTFIYTGFRPSFIIIKKTDVLENWVLQDDKTNPYNPTYDFLLADIASIPTPGGPPLDILSNGFKIRGDSGYFNSSGYFYSYMAFADQPLVTSNGLPANAR